MTPSNASEEDPPDTPVSVEPTTPTGERTHHAVANEIASPVDAVAPPADAVAPPADVAPELHDGGER